MLETTVWGTGGEPIVVRIGRVLESVTSGHFSNKQLLSPLQPLYQEVTRPASGASGDGQTLCRTLLSQETERRAGGDHHQETSPALHWSLLPGENRKSKEAKTN